MKIHELIDIDELAQSLKMSKGTIYNKVSKKEIPFLKIGGALRFSKSQIEKWIRQKNLPKKTTDSCFK